MDFNALHFFIVYSSTRLCFDWSSQGPRSEKTGRSIVSPKSGRFRTSLCRVHLKGSTLPMPVGQLILLRASKFPFVSRNHSRWSSRPSYRPQSSRHSDSEYLNFQQVPSPPAHSQSDPIYPWRQLMCAALPWGCNLWSASQFGDCRASGACMAQ